MLPTNIETQSEQDPLTWPDFISDGMEFHPDEFDPAHETLQELLEGVPNGDYILRGFSTSDMSLSGILLPQEVEEFTDPNNDQPILTLRVKDLSDPFTDPPTGQESPLHKDGYYKGFYVAGSKFPLSSWGMSMLLNSKMKVEYQED